MSTINILNRVAYKLGDDFLFEGLLKKVGRLKNTFAMEADDVVGFDCLATKEDLCYEFYCTNPPIEGCTIPLPVSKPLGIANFSSYKIDYKRAIEIFHSGKWGYKFASIVLYKPIYAEVEEPYWYFVSNLGNQVIIGADSGEVIR